jgi:hypothetical protein
VLSISGKNVVIPAGNDLISLRAAMAEIKGEFANVSVLLIPAITQAVVKIPIIINPDFSKTLFENRKIKDSKSPRSANH